MEGTLWQHRFKGSGLWNVPRPPVPGCPSSPGARRAVPSTLRPAAALGALLVLLLALPQSSRAASGSSDGPGAAERRGAGKQQQGFFCPPSTPVEPVPLGVSIPRLPAGRRPNFIVILMDDWGWDDVGLHNPKYVRTPNVNRFLKQATVFDNAYSASQCSPSRAMVLTGRHHVRVGTMNVQGGYDFISREETSAGKFMLESGYTTAHFGKWHNGINEGFRAHDIGFQNSWWTPGPMGDVIMHNGNPEPVQGYVEENLMSTLINHVKNNMSEPFFVYYSPYLVHNLPNHPLPVPPEYVDRYYGNATYMVMPPKLVRMWAFVEFADFLLGRLFDFLDEASLTESTYVMLTSDNGAYLYNSAEPQCRMPSNMQGHKSNVYEGGVRELLAVRGPGVQAGVVDSTLLSLDDILPTVADLADISASAVPHLPWSGLSFAHLLRWPAEQTAPPRSARLGDSRATQEQKDRYLMFLAPNCWDANAVPRLGEDGKTMRPQPLLDYDTGGISAFRWNTPSPERHQGLLQHGQELSKDNKRGFERCIAVRYKQYKFIGETGKVYSFPEGLHVELPQYEVTGQLGAQLAANMSAAARAWWQDVVTNEPHSFSKPTLLLGPKPGPRAQSAAYFDAAAAVERTFSGVRLRGSEATGFRQPGDRLCLRLEVREGGTYSAALLYEAGRGAKATMRLSASDAATGWYTSQDFTVLNARGSSSAPTYYSVGQLEGLPTSDSMSLCLELVTTSRPGEDVFRLLGTIRLQRKPSGQGTTDPAAGQHAGWAQGPVLAQPLAEVGLLDELASPLRGEAAEVELEHCGDACEPLA